MLKIRFVLVVLFLFTLTNTFAQDEVKRSWSDKDSLQWADFQGPVDASSTFAALTFSGISYKWHRQVDMGQVKFTFTAASFMDRSKSWTKPEKQTPALLKHERLHFDISEFFSRKLLEAFKGYTYTDNYKREIEDIYSQIMDARKKMEEEYDEQTNHSLNKIKQGFWELYVADLLDKNYTYEEALEKEPTF